MTVLLVTKNRYAVADSESALCWFLDTFPDSHWQRKKLCLIPSSYDEEVDDDKMLMTKKAQLEEAVVIIIIVSQSNGNGSIGRHEKEPKAGALDSWLLKCKTSTRMTVMRHLLLLLRASSSSFLVNTCCIMFCWSYKFLRFCFFVCVTNDCGIFHKLLKSDFCTVSLACMVGLQEVLMIDMMI